MQQRASIVRALAPDPGVMLMDEPFGALDAFTRDEMNLLLMRLWSETSKTIVFVTHNISEAIFLADRVVVMTPRPGRLARIFDIELPRPRTVDMTFEPEFIELIQEIKRVVEVGDRAHGGGRVNEVPRRAARRDPVVRRRAGPPRPRPDRLDRVDVGPRREEARSRSPRSSRSPSACSSASRRSCG